MASRFVSVIKEQILSADYSTCVVQTIIHLNVGESGGYLPRRFATR